MSPGLGQRRVSPGLGQRRVSPGLGPRQSPSHHTVIVIQDVIHLKNFEFAWALSSQSIGVAVSDASGHEGDVYASAGAEGGEVIIFGPASSSGAGKEGPPGPEGPPGREGPAGPTGGMGPSGPQSFAVKSLK